jgi:Flp pilus assembly protein TadG
MMRRLTDRDRGSVTLWLALASFAMIVLVGLTVDLSGQVYAQQRAIDVARQAARVAGQQIDPSQAVHGTTAQADTAQAVAAARSYLASSGLDGTVTISDGGTTIHVTTRATYQTKFLSVIGIQALQVSGTSDAQVVRVVNGTRR